MAVTGALEQIINRVNPWIAVAILACVAGYTWAERDHNQLRAEIGAKVDSTALTLLRRDISDLTGKIDQVNSRLHDMACEGKPSSCR